MRRLYRFQALLGALLLALVAGLFVVTGVPGHLDVLAFQAVLVGRAGVLLVLAGVRNPLRSRVGPDRLAGVGIAMLGAALPLGVVWYANSAGDYLLGGTIALGALALVLVGVDYVRGGEWFDVASSF